MNRTIAIFSLAAVATGVALTASGASTGTLYSNDFATRTSSDATPSGRWMEAAYVGGKLVRPVSSISENGREPYNNSTEYQDAWTMKTGYCRTEVTFTVADDGGNMGALVNASKSVNSASVAMQPFYNEFTTGVLKVSVDIRTPSLTDSFNSSAIACATLAPIYKSALEVSASAFPAPMRFGPANLQDTSGVWHLCAATRGRETANSPVGSYFGQNDSRNAIASGSWVRYGAEINLDAGTYTATFTNLGTGHPTPDTAGGSAVDFRQSEGDANSTTFAFLNPLTPETGGIAGLAFYVQGLNAADAAADAPMFDNIAVYWKASGEGKDYAPVYDNDFSTRRYRQVEPAGTNIGSYVPVLTTNVVQSSFYGRGTGTTDYGISESNARRLVPDGAPYLGQDGWRRIVGDAPFAMVDPNNNGGYGWNNESVLRSTGSGETGMVAVPLGTTVTSGKVRLSCDILMGALTNSTSQTRDIAAAAFLAGNGAFTNAWYDASVIRAADIAAALRDKGVCGAGTCRANMAEGACKTNTWIYGFNGSGYAPQDPGSDDGGSFYSGKWGRFVVTLDLDTWTYDLAVYDLGSVGQAMDYTTSSGNELVSTNGLALAASAVRNVDSVVLFSEGQDSRRSDNKYTDTYHGKRLGRFPLFDNVRVCLVNDDGTEGTELYACNFEYGYRLSVQNAASLAAHSDREGADRWIRRGNTYGTINAVDAGGGDNVVILDGFGQNGNETRAGYAVQPFGAVTKGLDSVEFTADIRPPERFADSSGCYAYVEVGGDAYAQGVYRPKTSSSWRVEPRIGFGFSVGAGKDDVGLCTNVLISVQTNTATVATAVSTNANYVIDKSHWYRFRVKADQTNGTFAVKVYDQGTAKPAANGANGTLVATFEDLDLPAFGENGMTTFGLAGAGFAGAFGGGIDDPYVALVDNLSASEYRIPAGFIAFLEENGIPTDTDPMTVTNGIPLAARYVYGIEPMDAMTNAEGHLLVDFQLSTDGAPVFELAPEKRPDDFGLIFSMLWSRTLSPWETLGEMCFDADNDGDDTLCHPPVNTSNEPCMFFKYRIVLPGYESPVEDPQTAFVDIAVKIIWNDNHNLDGNRPASVTIRLYADGVEVDSHVLTDAENWQFTFAENPRYQEDGKTEIAYTVREDAVPMYAVTIGGYSIVNDYLPEVTSVSVSKVWDDNNNSQCLRPSSITMTLSDGQKAVKSVILNAANEWAAIVDNLPTVVNGQPAQYTWSEQNVLGYELKEVTQQGSLTIFCNQIWDRPDNPSSGTKPKIPGEGGYEPEPDPGEGPL